MNRLARSYSHDQSFIHFLHYKLVILAVRLSIHNISDMTYCMLPMIICLQLSSPISLNLFLFLCSSISGGSLGIRTLVPLS